MTDNTCKTDCGCEPAGATVTARVDVYENDHGYVVHADMPGVAPQDVDIEFENGELTLTGKRTAGGSNRQALRTETRVSEYRRSFRIADHVAGDRIEATMNQGVLTLLLPKSDAVKPRKIAVKA